MLTFYVEDQLHERVRKVTDDAQNSFLQLARRLAADGSRVTDIIDPYADSMLNFIQLDRLVDELDLVIADGRLKDPELSKAVEVRDAAREARAMSGYLFVMGE